MSRGSRGDFDPLLIRVLSLSVVTCVIVAAYMGFLPTGTRGVVYWIMVILPTVAGLKLIWHPDTYSELTGVDDKWYVTNPTPRGCVAAIGWMLLFFPLVLGLISYLL